MAYISRAVHCTASGGFEEVFMPRSQKKEKRNSPYQEYASSLQVHGSIKTDASAQKL